MATRESLSIDAEFMRRLEQLSIVSRKVFTGKIKGERRSRKKGISVEFADYRDYSHGDDLRFVDWNIYGRLERLFTKLFMEEEDLFVYILVDTSVSMAFGSPSKLDYAKKAAAALGYIGLVNLDRVCVAGCSADGIALFPPTRGRQQMWRMFEFLDELKPSGRTSLRASFQSFVRQEKQKGIVIVISDFFDKEGYEEALKVFLAGNYDLFAVHLLSREEQNPDLAGDLRLLDAEDGTPTEISISSAMLKRYRTRLLSFTEDLNAACLRMGFNYLFTTTEVPFDQLILSYLRKAGLFA